MKRHSCSFPSLRSPSPNPTQQNKFTIFSITTHWTCALRSVVLCCCAFFFFWLAKKHSKIHYCHLQIWRLWVKPKLKYFLYYIWNWLVQTIFVNFYCKSQLLWLTFHTFLLLLLWNVTAAVYSSSCFTATCQFWLQQQTYVFTRPFTK